MSDRRASLAQLDAPVVDQSRLRPMAGVAPPDNQPSLGDIWRASSTVTSLNLRSGHDDDLYDAWQPVIDKLNDGRPWTQRYHNPYQGSSPTRFGTYLFDEHGDPHFAAPSPSDQEATAWAAVTDARAANPKAFPGIPDTLDAFHERTVQQARARLAQANSVLARNKSWAGTAASIGAGMVAGLDDPLVIATLPLGGMGRTIATKIATSALAQVGIAGTELAITSDRRKELGETLTARDVAANLGTAALLGAGFEGGAHVLAGPFGKLATKLREAIPPERMTDAERAAADALDRTDEIAATNPFQPGAGADAHLDRMDRATADLTDPAFVNSGNGKYAPPRQAIPPGSFDFRAYANKVGQAESGGKWDREATGSSAYGLYQITRPTLLRTLREKDPQYKLMSDDALWKMRTNPAVQESVFTELTRRNRAALARIGVPETNGNLYLMHFAGEGGGAKILRAAPETPIGEVMSQRAIEANPWLRGKTAGDVVAWAHGKMGETPHEGPVLKREGFANDEEWAAAQREVDAIDAEDRAAAAAEHGAAPGVRDDAFPGDRDIGADVPRAADAGDPFNPGTWADEAPPPAAAHAPDETPSGMDWEPAPADAPPSRDQRFHEAVRTLQEQQGGEAAGVLWHPEIGDIDLKWGSAGDPARNYAGGGGLAHVLAKHPEMREQIHDLPRLLEDMHVVSDDGRTVRLAGARHDAGVRLDWDGNDQRWLVTAYERGAPATPVSSRGDAGGRASPDLGAHADIGDAAAEIKTADGWQEPDPATTSGFARPEDAVLDAQTDSLAHDLRTAVEADPALADTVVRIDEDGKPVTIRDLLDELDADGAAIDAARACL